MRGLAPVDDERSAWDRVQRWLAMLLAVNVCVLLLLIVGLSAAGVPFDRAINSTVLKPVEGLFYLPTNDDSWWPMLKAHQNKVEHPESSLYSVFFEGDVKFQYPPSSLLPLELLPRSMTKVGGRLEFDYGLRQALRFLSLAALVGTALLSVMILKICLENGAGPAVPRSRIGVLALLGLACGLFWYPLVVGHYWGQIQVFLNFLIAAALLLYLSGKPAMSGACLALCCVVKPQYGLVLVWSALRRQWSFSLGLIGVGAVVAVLALWRYGLSDHLAYIQVLSFISQHGEAVWINQSLNGLLQRFVENAPAVLPPGIEQSEFPPFHTGIYLASNVFALLILLWTFWPRGESGGDGSVLDFAAIIVAITLASPVAWIHQYGAFLPAFALLTGWAACSTRVPGSFVPLLALSYLAMGPVVLRWGGIYATPWSGLVGSHLFLGGLLLLGLLLYARGHQSVGLGRVGQAA